MTDGIHEDIDLVTAHRFRQLLVGHPGRLAPCSSVSPDQFRHVIVDGRVRIAEHVEGVAVVTGDHAAEAICCCIPAEIAGDISDAQPAIRIGRIVVHSDRRAQCLSVLFRPIPAFRLLDLTRRRRIEIESKNKCRMYGGIIAGRRSASEHVYCFADFASHQQNLAAIAQGLTEIRVKRQSAIIDRQRFLKPVQPVQGDAEIVQRFGEIRRDRKGGVIAVDRLGKTPQPMQDKSAILQGFRIIRLAIYGAIVAVERVCKLAESLIRQSAIVQGLRKLRFYREWLCRNPTAPL